MNKYLVEIGELGFERISESYIAYSNGSKEDLELNDDFLTECDNHLVDMYYDYREEDEDEEDFLDSMGIIRIEDWKDEYTDYTNEIIYDERNYE